MRVLVPEIRPPPLAEFLRYQGVKSGSIELLACFLNPVLDQKSFIEELKARGIVNRMHGDNGLANMNRASFTGCLGCGDYGGSTAAARIGWGRRSTTTRAQAVVIERTADFQPRQPIWPRKKTAGDAISIIFIYRRRVVMEDIGPDSIRGSIFEDVIQAQFAGGHLACYRGAKRL